MGGQRQGEEMRGFSVGFIGLVAVVLSACTSTNSSTPQASPRAISQTDRSTQSSSVLWQMLPTVPLLTDKFAIEAELATRGETASGDEYLGRQTSSLVGVPAYLRSAPKTGDRDCGHFASSAEAQRFFLNNGGPYSDPQGLDRDGDGLACEFGTWLITNADRYRAKPAAAVTSPSNQASSSQCFVGPRGGTYTITASGRKNYGGC